MWFRPRFRRSHDLVRDRSDAARQRARPLVPLVSAGTLLTVTLLLASGAIASPANAEAASCISSGTDVEIQAALVGPDAVAALCEGSVFTLNNSIIFTSPGQKIQTAGLPMGDTRALLKVTGSDLSTAIRGGDKSGVTVQNLRIDGQRSILGRTGGEALLEMGGGGSDQTVQNNSLVDPRGWSAVHLTEGLASYDTPQCQNGKILNNTIGPSGTDAQGTWSDGISLACGHSLVENNRITNATDGGIVIFGAPGSQIRNNIITAQDRNMLAGIGMVDYGPVHGNYTGTVVSGNVINAAGSLIKIAIAMGTLPTSCASTDINYGATVTDNALEGPHMGYGFAVSGVKDWTVTGNVDHSTHVGFVKGSNCSGSVPPQPRGFQSAAISTTTLQPEFASAASLNALLDLDEFPATISIRANNGMFVTAEAGGNQPLIANRSQAGPWEKFDVTYVSGDQIQLRAEANGKFVCAEAAGTQPLIANRTWAYSWETFRLIRNTDGTVTLVAAANNKYVSSNNGIGPLTADRTANLSWERFIAYKQ